MIIGLCGYKGSGKDTVANYLVKNHNFIRLSFADALKDTVSILFSWDRELLQGDTKKSRDWRETEDIYWSKKLETKITPRHILQKMGTEVVRTIHPDFWIKIIESKIDPTKNYVITDTRFLNEMAFVKKYSGRILWILRDLSPFHQTIIDSIKNGSYQIANFPIHRSEWEFLLEDSKEVINNNGSLEELYKTIEKKLF